MNAQDESEGIYAIPPSVDEDLAQKWLSTASVHEDAEVFFKSFSGLPSFMRAFGSLQPNFAKVKDLILVEKVEPEVAIARLMHEMLGNVIQEDPEGVDEVIKDILDG